MKANTPEETLSKSIQTQNTIHTNPSLNLYHTAKSIAIFFSLPHELQTNGMIREMLAEKKHVYLPRVIDSATGHMEMYEVLSQYDFEHGLDRSEWNIMEPSFKLSAEVIGGSLGDIVEKDITSILTHPDFKLHFDGVVGVGTGPNQHDAVGRDVIGNGVGDEGVLQGLSQQQQSSSSSSQPPQSPQSSSLPPLDINRPSLLGTMECLRDIELILCPFITCDVARTRVGYGGGFYDRFIQRLQKSRAEMGLPSVPVWGIGLPEQLTPDDVVLPFDTFDVKMDVVVVGERVVGLD